MPTSLEGELSHLPDDARPASKIRKREKSLPVVDLLWAANWPARMPREDSIHP